MTIDEKYKRLVEFVSTLASGEKIGQHGTQTQYEADLLLVDIGEWTEE